MEEPASRKMPANLSLDEFVNATPFSFAAIATVAMPEIPEFLKGIEIPHRSLGGPKSEKQHQFVVKQDPLCFGTDSALH